MIRRILFGAGAMAWGGLTFLAGLYVTFPAEAARDRVMYEFGEYTKHEYALAIGDLSLWRLSGVALDEVTLYTVKKGRRTRDEPQPEKQRAPLISFDALSVRASPLALLTGKRAAIFDLEIYGGDIGGTFAESGEVISLDFEADDVDLSRLPVASDSMALKLLGLLSGEADLTLDQSDVKKSAGFVKLSFEGLGLGKDSTIGGFSLPEVLFTKSAVAFEAKDGKFEVTEGTFEGEVLNAELSGDIVLNKKLARSRNRLELAFSLPEDLDKLAQIAPDLKRARDDEGRYHLTIGGTVLSPTARFSRSGARRALPRGGDDGGGEDISDRPPRLDGAMGGGDLSDEERREARKKRIEERRERLRKRREEAERNNPLNGEDGPGRDFPEPGDEFGEPMDDGRYGPRFRGNDGPMDGPPGGPPDGPMMDEPGMDFGEEPIEP